MRNLKFNFASAKNILCFGEDGIDFHFSDYGNVILVKGVNYDNPGTSDEDRSNGAGKSSIPEILSIGLYGKTIKKPKKLKGGDIVNTLSGNGEIVVEWDDYRVLRSFRKTATGASSKIKIWESKDHIWDQNSEITRGTSKESQKWIEEKIGLTHNAFCSVVVFDDSDRYQFLEHDGPEKREFVENLLGLDVFRTFHDGAKSLARNQKQLIEKLARDYEILTGVIQESKVRIAGIEKKEVEWKTRLDQEIQQLLGRIEVKQGKLTNSDTGRLLKEWQDAQDKIGTLTTEIADLEEKNANFQKVVNDARERMEASRAHRDAINGKLQQSHLSAQASQQELEKHMALIDELESLTDGAKCPTCHGTISKNNYGSVLKHSKSEADGCRTDIQQYQRIIESDKLAFGEKAAKISNMEIKIKEAEAKFSAQETKLTTKRNEVSQLSKMSKPDGNAEERVLEAEITELRKQLASKKEDVQGDSPFKEIIEKELQGLKEKEDESKAKADELEAAEKELPYITFWVNAFSDKGIRKYVVDGIIPALNSRIAYWLQFLIDSRIELTFNNELEETITRIGNPVNYHGSSKGEGRRVNLAVSQAFAYVMMLNSGSCPSLVFLDEITGGAVDRAGVVGIYNMIFELAKERQVFVTTHNENLLSMLQGCETIRLEKRDDITRLVS